MNVASCGEGIVVDSKVEPEVVVRIVDQRQLSERRKIVNEEKEINGPTDCCHKLLYAMEVRMSDEPGEMAEMNLWTEPQSNRRTDRMAGFETESFAAEQETISPITGQRCLELWRVGILYSHIVKAHACIGEDIFEDFDAHFRGYAKYRRSVTCKMPVSTCFGATTSRACGL